MPPVKLADLFKGRKTGPWKFPHVGCQSKDFLSQCKAAHEQIEAEEKDVARKQGLKQEEIAVKQLNDLRKQKKQEALQAARVKSKDTQAANKRRRTIVLAKPPSS